MKGNGIMGCFGFQGKQKPVCFSVSSRHYTLVCRLCGSLFRVVNHSRLFSKILYGFLNFSVFSNPVAGSVLLEGQHLTLLSRWGNNLIEDYCA